ncbi:MAG: hypothetical protein ABI906_02505 [Pseudomonadota bacterium]
MRSLKSLIGTGALGAAAAIGIVAAATPASAYIACNRYGECWHAANRYAYPAGLRIAIYPDTWRKAHPRSHWLRDRDDRGYWNHGAWRRF